MRKVFVPCLAMLMWTSVAFAGININTAPVSTLDDLPGIGPAKAQAIVQDRKAHGAFKSKQELTRVKGIGPKIFEKLKDQIDL